MLYESPITLDSTDSTLATSDAVKSEVLSPVQSDLTNTYGVTNTYMREPDTYMREADIQDTGSEDSRSEWQISTVKAEDLAPYSPASSDASFAPLTVAESPSSSTDYPTHDGKQVGKGGRKRGVEKGTSEYVEKRARNNVAVRKSRAKAKEKQKTTENKVNILLSENEQLQKKVDLLTKELTVLKGLFINVGTAIPDRFAKLMEQ